MTERCEDLDPFFDRELGAEADEEFRDHLASCKRCQEVLLGRMLEAAVVAGDDTDRPSVEPVPPPDLDAAKHEPRAVAPAALMSSADPGRAPPTSSATSTGAATGATPGQRPARERWPMLATTAALAAAAAVVVAVCPMDAGTRPAPVSITLAAERTVQARFSAPALDRYRPLGVMRAAGDAATEQITLKKLTALEQADEVPTLVGALALNGDLASARRAVRKLPGTARGFADRAALELLSIDRAGAASPALAQRASAERALSLTADALRIEPGVAQAMWNQAIALTYSGLTLAAARVFDDVARLREPGWSDEATATAARLRRAFRDQADEWRQVTDAAARMIVGGEVLADRQMARAPGLARDAFYLALATAATRDRIAALEPLARALDAHFATTALGDLLARVRASDLRIRAPFSAELRDFIALHKPPEAIDDLRARARSRGLHDLVLASFLAVGENTTEDDDLALLDKLLAGSRDDWWKLVALARRAYVMEFWHRDYPAVDAIERLAEPICRTMRTTWCRRIMLFAGGASSQMGRADLAIEQISGVLQQARSTQDPDDELAALDALGEAIAMRVTDDLDASAVAGAYLEEVSLRKATCDTRLRRLDFAANAALQRHRLDQAAALRSQTDALEHGACRGARLRLNGETARLRLALTGRARVEPLRDDLAELEAGHQPNQRLYLDFLSAAATLIDDRPRGERALRQVIAASAADLRATYAPLARAAAFDALVESAAASRDPTHVLALLGERLGAPRFARCVLGAASWNRLVVAAIDGDGVPALETREIPDGTVAIPAPEVVSQALRARLAGCRRVDVMAPGPYLGAPRLLGDGVAWVYHTGTPRTSRGATGRRELVVSQVLPPDDLHLPALQPFSAGGDAEVLSGARATPANVLAAMAAASLVVIVAHGFADASEPTAASLILSPDAQGDYLLTASKVRSAKLAGSPVVILAGCDAGRVQVSADPWSLATSFLEAGARIVIAPTEPIPDASAGDVFRSLVERIRTGADPVDALVAERRVRGPAAAWLSSIVVFE